MVDVRVREPRKMAADRDGTAAAGNVVDRHIRASSGDSQRAAAEEANIRTTTMKLYVMSTQKQVKTLTLKKKTHLDLHPGPAQT